MDLREEHYIDISLAELSEIIANSLSSQTGGHRVSPETVGAVLKYEIPSLMAAGRKGDDIIVGIPYEPSKS